MRSERQIPASRANTEKFRGPVTLAGRLASSNNRIDHAGRTAYEPGSHANSSASTAAFFEFQKPILPLDPNNSLKTEESVPAEPKLIPGIPA